MIRINLKNAARSLAGAAVVALAMAGSAAAANWKCYTFIPVATDPTYIAHQDLAKDLKDKSGGDLDMNCFLGGALPIKSNTIVQAVSDGVIQFASANPNALQTVVQFAGVLSLPGLFDNDAELEKGLAIATPYIEKALNDRGVRLLGWSHFPQAAVFGTGQIRNSAAMKGLKIRVSTPEQSELIRRLGGTPVVIASPEVSSALSTGVIQGVLTSNSGGGRAWKDLFKSTLRIGTNFTPFVYIVNESALQALPEGEQTLLSETVGAFSKKVTQDLVSDDDAILAEFQSGGMTIYQPEGDDQQIVGDLMRDFWDSWGTENGEDAKKVLAEIRAALGK